MGKKKKLIHFEEIKTFNNVYQPTFYEAIKDDFPLKGKWAELHFKNNNPIVLELGCGKGEYTVGLANKYPEKNFIGIDNKGARIWRGSKTAFENGMGNVAFLRTQVDLVEYFFSTDEISEIWITFPDPQPKKPKKRLTSPVFLNRYHKILKTDGLVHLKTDNTMLYEYTLEVIDECNHKLHFSTNDLYNSSVVDDILSIKTFYEQKFLDLGMKINYANYSINL